MSDTTIIGMDFIQAGIDTVLGIDPSQAPSDPEALNERLTHPQGGITSAFAMLLGGAAAAKQLKKGTPLVYAVLEAASRAHPEKMKEEITTKQYLTSLASVAAEATSTVKGTPSADAQTVRSRQPELVKFLDGQLLAPNSFMQKLTLEEKTGIYAMCLGTVRSIERHVAGAEKPVTVTKTPGRNDPCSCGSGKKYKKCHGA